MTTDTTLTAAPTTWRTVARWLVSFVGFPLGAVAAMLVAGAVDGVAPALVGGLVSGAVIGLAQAWAMRADRRLTAGWTVATALGLSAGLAVGSGAVGFGTTLADLVVQGAVCGLAVGAAQTVLLLPRIGAVAWTWPAYLSAVWALGWLVTTTVGVEVDERFTVFGSSGAVTVTLLTAVLPLRIHHPRRPR
ncbi:MAG: hypothetical protein HOQ22_09045 [Nocardioidaceae bacterium]|nr:hypothetical protein [Nocardioidaceae bacterium]